MITTILSGLALLVVTVNLILTIREKKRGEKRNAALETWKRAISDFIDAENYNVTNQFQEADNALQAGLDLHQSQLLNFKAGLNKCDGDLSECFKKLDVIAEDLEAMKQKVNDLEKGIMPDYEEALAAKNAVDEFSKGLSAILNYDPVESYRKKQQKEKYGVEDD